jgi:signal transduction histidine kinase
VGVYASVLRYRYSDVSVRDVVEDACNILRWSADECGVRIVQPPVDDASFWGDAGRVRQILLNLGMNAIKYGAQRGGCITIQAVVMSDVMEFRVSDDGPGIPRNKLETIFEPFLQLAPAGDDSRGGVGLGLAISRDLARAMRGELAATSAIGAGARFTLTLPIT